jgi:hypothetical protein
LQAQTVIIHFIQELNLSKSFMEKILIAKIKMGLKN